MKMCQGTPYFMFIFNYALQSFKVYCAIWVRRSNFLHQASPLVSPRESTQQRKVKLWVRKSGKFYLNANFHVTCGDLLHAVKLRREGRCVYRVLVGKPGGRRPMGRPRRRWEDNIRMDLREVGCGCVDWIGTGGVRL
jgi:hypothetical protein